MPAGILEELAGKPREKPLVTLVMGKGGVGKTTVSILLSSLLSSTGETLLSSLDQAMHLLEYLGLEKPMKKKRITSRLDAVQVDAARLIDEAAREYMLVLQSIMPALTVLNLDDVLKTLRYNPGFEEEAYLRYIERLYGEAGYEFIVVDTPPTGATYRILRLPRLYTMWTSQLQRLRERIVSLRYVIARTLDRRIEPRDPVLDKLRELHSRYEELHGRLADTGHTRYVVVMTPEPLPLHETLNTIDFLEEMGTGPTLILVNRLLPEDIAEKLGTRDTQETIISRLLEVLDEKGCKCGVYGIQHTREPPRTYKQAVALAELLVRIR